MKHQDSSKGRPTAWRFLENENMKIQRNEQTNG